MAWTLFDHAQRRVFAGAVDLDEATWRRGRAWALWKALITVRGGPGGALYPIHAKALPQILDDPVVGRPAQASS